MKSDYDVIIIGGGPAGSSLAAYLSLSGIRSIVFEKEVFPRHHVGESLVPAANRVLTEIGAIDKMEANGFPRKYGAAWTADGSRAYSHDWEDIPPDCKVDIRFDERAMYANRNYTYHVDRSKFDHMLLEHAAGLGAVVSEGTRVERASFAGGLPEVEVNRQGRRSRVKARVIVDASGRDTLLGSQLRIKEKDRVFNQFAVHTWFDGFDRGDGDKSDYIFIHFLPMPNSWLWQIPISDTVTSFGLVTQKAFFPKTEADREKFFWNCIDAHPTMSEKLRAARRITPMRAEGDYSYAMQQFCGDGWALIGDAARFVDPIFSSGVSVALNSARFVADDIVAAMTDLPDGAALRRNHLVGYESILRKGVKNWYEFISLYYRLNVLFTKFVYDPRHRPDVLKLLSGDVYEDESPPVLSAMRSFVQDVEANPNHVLHAHLGRMTSDAFRV